MKKELLTIPYDEMTALLINRVRIEGGLENEEKGEKNQVSVWIRVELGNLNERSVECICRCLEI